MYGGPLDVFCDNVLNCASRGQPAIMERRAED